MEGLIIICSCSNMLYMCAYVCTVCVCEYMCLVCDGAGGETRVLAVAGVYPCPACSLSSSVDCSVDFCVKKCCSYSCVRVYVHACLILYIFMYPQYLYHMR